MCAFQEERDSAFAGLRFCFGTHEGVHFFHVGFVSAFGQMKRLVHRDLVFPSYHKLQFSFDLGKRLECLSYTLWRAVLSQVSTVQDNVAWWEIGW